MEHVEELPLKKQAEESYCKLLIKKNKKILYNVCFLTHNVKGVSTTRL